VDLSSYHKIDCFKGCEVEEIQHRHEWTEFCGRRTDASLRRSPTRAPPPLTPYRRAGDAACGLASTPTIRRRATARARRWARWRQPSTASDPLERLPEPASYPGVCPEIWCTTRTLAIFGAILLAPPGARGWGTAPAPCVAARLCAKRFAGGRSRFTQLSFHKTTLTPPPSQRAWGL